ncbi:AfsR/SARP family transcriptional regulator [Actinosynnema sp. CS-041913]|uniref:AfsR/SARP family transcriptional regulator n=1 Tax=Actinosynnema sp. CS-041913 TaxID=3239917 RepID=UPI003D936105
MKAAFTLLGEVAARVGDALVDLGPARQRTVLAVLLVDANEPVPGDRLADRVWGDRPPHRAASTLRTYLARLRAALRDGDGWAIERRPAGYALRCDPDAVDLHRFRDLVARARAVDDEQADRVFAAAFELWRGEPFAGLDTPWLAETRRHLEADLLAARLDHHDVRLRLGRHADLVAGMAALAAEHPQDERLAAQHMLALYRSGRQAAALDRYRQVRIALAEELGLDPSAALQELWQRMLRADPALDTTARPTAAHPTAAVDTAAVDTAASSTAARSTAAHPTAAVDTAAVETEARSTATHPTAARPTAAVDTAARPTTEARRPVPRQLPPAPRSFIGREDELGELTAALGRDDAGLVVVAIVGAGGVGKTWLALRWAHDHLDRFPDGELYANLRGFTAGEQPAPPASVVRGFLEALGVAPSDVPADLDAQTALYRSLLAGKRMLVLLDNARDTAQVTALLPGTSSATVLVTSRDRLIGLHTTQSAHPVPVGLLDAREATRLLVAQLGEDRVTADRHAAREMVGLAAGLPLALSILAARARTRPGAGLAWLVDELRDATARLDALDTGDLTADLRAVFESSHAALPDATARAFRLLAVAPGADISAEAAAGLLDEEPRRAGILLRSLESAHLVQRVPPGRYRMHDLVRLYATEQAGADEAAAGLRRLCDFLLHSALAADRLLDPHRPAIDAAAPAATTRPHRPADINAAVRWLREEHATLLAAQRAAASHGLHTHAWQLAWALHGFRRKQGYHHDNQAAWQVALDSVNALGDTTGQAMAHRCLGINLAQLGEHRTALTHLGRSLDLVVGSGDLLGQAHTHYALTQSHDMLGNLSQALHHAAETCRLYEVLDKPVERAHSLNALGWCHARTGDLHQAREHCELSLALHRRHDSPVGASSALDSLGYISHRLGDLDVAARCYTEALGLYGALDIPTRLADVFEQLGTVQAARGRTDEARTAWRRALDLFRAQQRHLEAQRVEQLLHAG